MSILSKENFINNIITNAKAKTWINSSFDVQLGNAEKQTVNIGVKAFGRWIQRLQVNGLYESITEQKTNKALKQSLEQYFEDLEKRLGLS